LVDQLDIQVELFDTIGILLSIDQIDVLNNSLALYFRKLILANNRIVMKSGLGHIGKFVADLFLGPGLLLDYDLPLTVGRSGLMVGPLVHSQILLVFDLLLESDYILRELLLDLILDLFDLLIN
jgi:hypothetical protein